MNELADEQAELGRMAEEPEICPGPQKYGSLWLRVRPAVLGLQKEAASRSLETVLQSLREDVCF